ncbi:unnamed protein product [Kuraishia capsulata CBS 1993]|uniref:Uncharacterized protein n=1 Tax=Kuraishia capsulata CBS 1993 TaxID=1382522 RepID=W6MTE1_9ASCO|nr:uncharacterized protein KUCA_T00000962001 [Kuraishia capsulata CBS 1993]CDK24995.1 unnamed protein product [Kuraishia capsulata CBS 1993]
MFILLLVFVIILLVAVTIFLPAVAGVAKYNLEHKREAVDEYAQEHSGFEGEYIPPDELQKRDEDRKAKSGKFEKIKNATMSDLPLKFKADLPNIRKRNTTQKSTGQFDPEEVYKRRNPDTYDYDLDDIINEELENDRREQAKQPAYYTNDPAERQKRLEELM